MKILVSRIVAEDLAYYWEEVGALDDTSEFAADNADCLAAVREAHRAVSIAAIGSSALRFLELSAEALAELKNEAENRCDIYRSAEKDTRGTHEHGRAQALYRAYRRVLKQEGVS